MAAYPTLPQKTTIKPAGTAMLDLSDGGTVRVASLGIADRYDVTIEHEWLTATELGTLQTFWSSNKYTTVTVTAGDGDTYDCLLATEPEVTVLNASRFNARVSMNGVRN